MPKISTRNRRRLHRLLQPPWALTCSSSFGSSRSWKTRGSLTGEGFAAQKANILATW